MDLFNKYGGAEFWSDFLNAFYSRITTSNVLSHHFVDKNVSHIKIMLIGLLEVTLVSDGEYSEEKMAKTHDGMGITNEELDDWISIYTETLKEFGVLEQDIVSLVELVNKYRTSIVSKDYS